MNVTSYGKGDFADVIKDLEIRITWVGPNCHHNCPYKWQTEGDLTEKKAVWSLKQNAMLLTLKIEEGATSKEMQGMQLWTLEKARKQILP